MKVIIQIPCLNEAQTLPVTVASLPRELPGVDRIEILVVDDGSTDGTAEVARKLGVDHVFALPSHQGLAYAFQVGLETSLKLGADIIVSTDGDNQYDARDMENLIRPILEQKADIVIGERPVSDIEHFSYIKKQLHRVGNQVMRRISGLETRDATSGFRAFGREAALRLNVFSRFTYTLETLIQAGKKRLAVAYVPVSVNKKLRDSRLFPNLWFYLKRSASTMVRIYSMYEPLKVFSYVGMVVAGVGFLMVGRFVFIFMTQPGPSGHLQSLLAGTVLVAMGLMIGLIGIVSDLIAANRKLAEDIQYRIRVLELDSMREGNETPVPEAVESRLARHRRSS